MLYSRQGEYLTVSRITGPSHNLLQLRLTQEPDAEPQIERLNAIGACEHGPLSDQAVLDAVKAGVAQANAELDAAYAIDRVRFVDNDSPPEAIYGMLAGLILRRFHSGDEFAAI